MKEEQAEHSLVCPSGAHRWLECSGSVALCAGLIDEPNEMALRGTALHKTSERVLRDVFNDGQVLDHALGRECGEFTEEDGKHVRGFCSYVLNRWKICGRPALIVIEERIVMRDVHEMFGHVDIAFGYELADDGSKPKAVAEVIDLKTGHEIVPAKYNPQLAYYAMLFDSKHGPFDSFIGSIYQEARTLSGGRRPVDTWEFDRETLLEWRDRLTEGARTALAMLRGSIRPEYRAGDWCKHCLARGPKCETYMQYVSDQAQIDFSDGENTDLVVFSQPPSAFTPERLSAIVLNRKRIENFLDAVEKYAIDEAMAGRPLPDTKVIRTSGRRMLLDEKTVVAECAALGVDPFKKTLKTVGELGKKISPDDMKRITKKSGTSLKIVSVSDSGQAVDPVNAIGLDFESPPEEAE